MNGQIGFMARSPGFLIFPPSELVVSLKDQLEGLFDIEVLNGWGAFSALDPVDQPCLVVFDANLVAAQQDGYQILAKIFPNSVRGAVIDVSELNRITTFPAESMDKLVVWSPNHDFCVRQLFELTQLFEILQNLRIFEKLASSDPLTGLRNKRYFADRLSSEFERARRYNRPLSLLLLDLDNFKTVNDTHGHTEGDGALLKISQVLVDTLRSTDLLARLGGDEFSIILPETSGDGALVVAERIRSIICSDQYFQDLKLTVSIGAASYPDHATTSDELRKATDRGLMKAKAIGKNNSSAPSPTNTVPKAKSGGQA